VTGAQGVAAYELHILWRMWSHWRPHIQSGRCIMCHRHISQYSEISWNTAISRSSVCHFIHELLRATHSEENTLPIQLLVYSRKA